MPGEMHWGPFTLQWSLLSWAIALLAGYYLMYWRLRSDLNESLNNELLTIISNALFAYLVVWKFGAVISDNLDKTFRNNLVLWGAAGNVLRDGGSSCGSSL
jgi:glucan phosphoethanolaminetransferase (alkaline phosphatase superfamily)